MRLSRLLLFTFIGTVLMFQSPGSALACSCMMPESIQESIEDADAVFLGTVKNISRKGEQQVAVTIEVEEKWKGTVTAGAETKIMTAYDSAACGYSFTEDEEYLVYAYHNRENGNLGVSLCSATAPSENAAEDLKILASYTEPVQSPECSPYMCKDGTEIARCSEHGHVINYFAAPCMTHGGEVGEEESASFSDVPSSHPNAEAIAFVRAKGIVEGYSDGTYRPDLKINRAEFAKILEESIPDAVDGVGLCPPDPADFSNFSDVNGEWFWIYVCMQQGRGIVDGYPDGTFRPAENINFVEAAKMIFGSMFLDNHGLFTQDMQSDPWYEPYAMYIADYRAIPLSVLSLDHQITRGEMAEIIWRIKTQYSGKAFVGYESLVRKSR